VKSYLHEAKSNQSRVKSGHAPSGAAQRKGGHNPWSNVQSRAVPSEVLRKEAAADAAWRAAWQPVGNPRRKGITPPKEENGGAAGMMRSPPWRGQGNGSPGLNPGPGPAVASTPPAARAAGEASGWDPRPRPRCKLARRGTAARDAHGGDGGDAPRAEPGEAQLQHGRREVPRAGHVAGRAAGRADAED